MGNTKISATLRSRRLNEAVAKLSPYFGLETIKTSTSALAAASRTIGDISRTPQASQREAGLDSVSANGVNNEDKLFGDILERFINVSVHADSADDFAKFIFDRHAEHGNFNSLMNIIGTGDNIAKLRSSIPIHDESLLPLSKVTTSPGSNDTDVVPMLKHLLSTAADTSEAITDGCNISIILSNTPQLSLAASNVNACSIFLNGTRAIDMSKAVPYLEVNFEIPLAGTGRVDASGNAPGAPGAPGSVDRLLAPSLYKFIMGGAVVAPNSTLSTLTTANKLTEETREIEANLNNGIQKVAGIPAYTRVGMEIFTSPQTLVNGDERNDENTRVNPVQDKFRPFMSLKDFSATIMPNGFGSQCYSSAKLSMKLHDKSRLAEISSFIRADLFGRTHVEVEYGWTHPDGESLIRDNVNYFADVINGMRKKERYQIIASTFSFTENGEVDIGLQLATLAAPNMIYSLLGSTSENTAIKLLRDTQDEINRLIRITHADEQASRAASDEHSGANLLGIQIINSVTDGFDSGFHLSADDRTTLRQFVNSHDGGGENMTKLRNLLQKLYNGDADDDGGGSVSIAVVKQTIENSIKGTIKQIVAFQNACSEMRAPPSDASTTAQSGPAGGRRQNRPLGGRTDPFLTKQRNSIAITKQVANTVRAVSTVDNNSNTRRLAPAPVLDIGDKRSASLASIVTAFIGVPLAKAGKDNGLWQEVQFVYHTFNGNAGFAGGTNISGFEIDLNFFYDRYKTYRIANISRSSDMTLTKFWQFLNQDIIDDVAAPTYGLWDTSGSLSRITLSDNQNRDDPSRTSAAEWADEDYKHTERITRLLSENGTHNGEWVPPVLALSVENLEVNPDSSSSVTPDPSHSVSKILRIHIFDRTAAQSESLNAIMLASRQRSMSISGDGEAPVGRNSIGGNNVPPDPIRLPNHLALSAADLQAVRQHGLVRRRADWTSMIARARDNNFIELIHGTERYRVKQGFRELKKFVMNNCAYLIPGAQGSLIRSVSLGSMQDANASIQLVSNPRPSEQINPNGSGDRGLPLSVMPVEVSMETSGCPLLTYTSNFFIDFNTNTMIDDIWQVSGIDHKIGEGNFTSNIRFRPIQSYGRYKNYLNQLRDMADAINPASDIFIADTAATGGGVPAAHR